MKFTFKASYFNKAFFNILIFICLGFATALAQPKWKLNVSGKVEENGKSLEGASVKMIKSDGAPVVVDTPWNGKFCCSLDPNSSDTAIIT